MLPAELPEELKNVAIDGKREASPQSGDGYGIVFLNRPAENISERLWNNAEGLATFEVFPQSQPKFNQDYYDATSGVDTVELPDGTEAKLRRMEPRTNESLTANPYWEGEFDKYGRRYSITTIRDKLSKEAMKQLLSTMVEVSRPEQTKTASEGEANQSASVASSSNHTQAEVEKAVGDYYHSAGAKDWDYTYDHLDSQTKQKFTKEEWKQKNQWFADNNPSDYRVLSAKLDNTSQEPLAEVAVRLTGEDGSTSTRNTYFVFEDGSWKHRFAQEEIDLFRPDLSYEEFVEAKQ